MTIDPVTLIYILFFVGGIARPLLQYALARLEDGLHFNWRYLWGQIAGVVLGFLSLVTLGQLPDLKEILDGLNLPGVLIYVAAFGYGYFWASIGRQGDKAQQLARTGSSKV